ncbi:MAG: hypothetical protein ACREB3_03660 [Burkholderiales bacterium]
MKPVAENSEKQRAKDKRFPESITDWPRPLNNDHLGHGGGPSMCDIKACLGLGKLTLVLVRLMSNNFMASFYDGRAKLVASGSAALRVQMACLVTLTITPSGAPNCGKAERFMQTLLREWVLASACR